MNSPSAKDAFLKDITETGPRVLEALISQSQPESGQTLPMGTLFTAKRIAEVANGQTSRNNARQISPGEVPYALAPYVGDGIVGVRTVYGGPVPRNGEDPGREYAFEVLNPEAAGKIASKSRV